MYEKHIYRLSSNIDLVVILQPFLIIFIFFHLSLMSSCTAPVILKLIERDCDRLKRNNKNRSPFTWLVKKHCLYSLSKRTIELQRQNLNYFAIFLRKKWKTSFCVKRWKIKTDYFFKIIFAYIHMYTGLMCKVSFFSRA